MEQKHLPWIVNWDHAQPSNQSSSPIGYSQCCSSHRAKIPFVPKTATNTATVPGGSKWTVLERLTQKILSSFVCSPALLSFFAHNALHPKLPVHDDPTSESAASTSLADKSSREIHEPRDVLSTALSVGGTHTEQSSLQEVEPKVV